MDSALFSRIVRDKIPCIFVSPHMDDAAFSAGGLLLALSQHHVPVTIVNVFTGDPHGASTWSARRYLKTIGYTDPVALYRDRRTEDAQALNGIATVHNLGFVEALWRTSPETNKVIYPIYRLHIQPGRLRRADLPNLDAAQYTLQQYLPDGPHFVFCPIGYGGHVDHVFVRELVERIVPADRRIYWQDIPYITRSKKNHVDNWAQYYPIDSYDPTHTSKVALCKAYKTQYQAVFSDHHAARTTKELYYQKHPVALNLSPLRLLLKAFLLSPKDTLYNLIVPPQSTEKLRAYDPKIEKAIDKLKKQIHLALPQATVRLIGSSDLRISGHGDIDMIVAVGPQGLRDAEHALTNILGKSKKAHQHQRQWKLVYEGYPLDLDLLTIKSKRYDIQTRINDLMHEHPEYLTQYLSLKQNIKKNNLLMVALQKIIFFETILRNKHVISFPQRVMGYNFVSKLRSTNGYSHYACARYQNNHGKTAILKLSRTQSDNKNLAKEYAVYTSLGDDAVFRTPSCLAFGTYCGRSYLLTQEIRGTSLRTLPTSKQVAVYAKIIAALGTIELGRIPGLPRRGPWFWLAAVPLLFVRAIIHGAQLSQLVPLLTSSLTSLPHLFMSRNRVLVHRDLKPDNILITPNDVYLFDYELLCKADPIIELAALYYQHILDTQFTDTLTKSSLWRKLIANHRDQHVFRSYLALIAMYNLGSPHELMEKVEKAIMSLRTKKKNTRFHPWSGLMIFVLAACILGATLRGHLGVPVESELNDPYWKENGPFELSPERGRFALTYSLVEHGTSFFSLPLARFTTPDLGYKDGKYVSLFAPAVSYLSIPGYYLGKILGASQVGAYATMAFFGLFNAYLLYRLVKRITTNWIAGLLGGLTFLFATPAYAYAVNLYQHQLSTWIVLMTTYLVLFYNSWWSLSIIWFLCALGLTVDYPNVIFLLPIGLLALGQLIVVRIQPTVRLTVYLRRLLTVAGFIIPLFFFMQFNAANYGSPFKLSGTVQSVDAINQDGKPVEIKSLDPTATHTEIQGDTHQKTATGFFKTRNLVNGLYIHLFSPDRSLLVFAPVLVIGLLGALATYRKNKSLTVLLSSIATADLLLYSLWGDPWGGWAFGSRYLIPAYAVLAIFVGVALDRYRRNLLVMGSFAILAIYSVMVNTAGALSTSANPPQVQVLALEALSGKRERYSWDRNVEYLQQGSSKSFVYQTWLHDRVTAWQYYLGVSTLILGLFAILMVGLIRAPGKSTKGEV